MDFEKYKLAINIKSACYYEQISGKNFFQIGADAEDILMLVYASLVTNNDIKITYKTFLSLIEDEKVIKWIEKEYKKMSDMDNQLKVDVEALNTKDKGRDDVNLTMTELASALIIQHKVDAHYVMYEMEMWEIMPYFKIADSVKKDELVEKRLWTYLTVSPQIDTKKCKSPDKLLPFPWEEGERKAKQERDLKNNEFAIRNMIGKDIFGNPVEKEKKDGE